MNNIFYNNKEGFQMKLREAIKDITGDEWLDISEIKRGNPHRIGRITKELLRGEILNREVVVNLSNSDSPDHGHSIHRFYVTEKQRKIHKFQ
jgi:hypothetical protein